ncbi:hypothetical protein AVV29_gp012 [Vibrio phage phi 3]|uniref:Uncharacterized protein n=1 Tax=Vibrio phage phi 3 TaxID=1589298 RepID=A0A0B5HE42_9CAUD|nr:hypothetical protein AVV29_gp012 [Vibrio phage phi 3]AJF40780.1 hypothetical protein SBVP3_0012 [Vibrio phage phi 3]
MQLTKFRYLGGLYEVPKLEFESCIKRNTINRLFALTNMGKRDHYFFILTTEENGELRWFSTYSKNPKYYKTFNKTVKHLVVKELTKEQAKFLHKSVQSFSDFRQAIAYTKEAIKTILEIA